MKFETYENRAACTAIYPERGDNLIYPVLGLLGEAGEIANKVKKIHRDHGGEMTEEIQSSLVDEIGDVLWYLAAVAHELGFRLEDIAELNLTKLAHRKNKGTLTGSGDNR